MEHSHCYNVPDSNWLPSLGTSVLALGDETRFTDINPLPPASPDIAYPQRVKIKQQRNVLSRNDKFGCLNFWFCCWTLSSCWGCNDCQRRCQGVPDQQRVADRSTELIEVIAIIALYCHRLYIVILYFYVLLLLFFCILPSTRGGCRLEPCAD